MANVDIASILIRKRDNLIKIRDEIQNEANRQVQEIEEDLEGIRAALNTFNELAKDLVCPSCEGSGSIRYTDAAGSRDYKTCPACKGTGVNLDKEFPARRCGSCKHRPFEVEDEGGNNRLKFPDHRCPCYCAGDEWYSWMPDDDWFCANWERKEINPNA